MGALEPRVLFSATPIDPALMDADGQEAASVLVVEADGNQASQESGASSIFQSTSGELIVIDGNVPELQSLLDDLSQSRPNAEVFVLDPTRDGVEQITELLDSHSDLDSLHIVSHGQDSAIRLGNVWLGNDNLSAYAGEIALWQSALSSDADILFYGCDLASDADGRDFLESMQALTNADIAASDDITGHESLGGDWDLEFQAGTIQTDVAFSMQLRGAWEHELAGVVIDVTIFDDIVDGGDGETSLREAVTQAIAGDTIRLGAGVHLVDNSINLTRNFAIVGFDARTTIIDASGATGDRVFNIDNDAIVDISKLTIQGGSQNNGGAIFVDEGTLNLSDAILRNNSSNQGGAIHVHGTAHLNRVLLTGNHASGDGGAIHFDSDGSGSLTNVTISGNTSVGDGGGVHLDTSATVTITNSTITGNDADKGGGIANEDGTAVIRNTIVAGNTADNSHKDVNGAFSSDGSNLIGVTNGSSGLGTDTVSSNVGLLSLGNYGGQTDTHALQSNSIAIDAGTFAGGPTVDARGITRDSQRDIGAFEATSSLFWLSTRDGSGAPSGALGLDSWTSGEVIEISDPNLQLGPGGTGGTFSSVFDLGVFADDSDVDIDGLHYVTQNITLGTTTTIDLQPGDLLISTRTDETFNSNAFSVNDSDIFLFRPDSPGAYHSGTFTMVLSRLDQLPDPELMAVTDIWSFSLVEQDTILGDTTLSAGDFLFTMAVAPEENDIFIFHTVDVGDGTTNGTADRLIEGDDLGIDLRIVGLELIETTTTIGGETVQSGELLVSVGRTESDVGTNEISVDRQDIFRLQVSETTLVAGTAVANAAILLDGSSLGLDTNQEEINALALIPSAASAGTTIAYEGFDYAAGSLDGQNGGSGWASGWTLHDGASAQVDAPGLTAPSGLVPGIGGTLEMNTTGQFEQRRDLATTLGADGTTAWFSFLVRPDGVSSGGISLLIGDGTGTDNTVNVGTSGNDFLLGIDSSASGATIDNVVSDAQTYFLVVRIDFEAGDDTVTLYVDPTPSGSSPDSPSSLTTQLTTADLGTFTRLAVVGGLGGNHSNIDEIRVGTSYRSVAPLEANAAPTDSTVATTTVDENTDTSGGFNLGFLNVSDPDGGETFSFEVVGGADESLFAIGGEASNQLILDDGILDFENQSTYEVAIRVTDSGSNTLDSTLIIGVNDLNDSAPVIDTSTVFVVAENTANGNSLGNVTATDADTVGSLTNWSITDGNTGEAFAIDGNTGELTVNDATAIDFESNDVFILAISVSDGVNTVVAENLEIQVTDTPELHVRDEFRVNTTTTDEQVTSAAERGSQQSVSLAADGSYVVVWTSENQSGVGDGIYARRFDSAGNSITGEILIAELDNQDNQWARVASANDGAFVVTWTLDSQGVKYRRFASDGSPLTSVLNASTTTTGDQTNSVIAINSATGEFVIAWQGNGDQSGQVDDAGIFAQRFNADGTADGNEFRVNSQTDNTQFDASIAMNDSGDFVVTWDDTDGVHFQRFNQSGSPQGGQITVDGDPTAGNADVAIHDDGSFVVTWRESDTNDREIFFRRYDSDGNALTSAVSVNTFTNNNQTNPSISMDDARRFIIVWEGRGTGETIGIFAQKYDGSGNTIGDNFLVNQTINGSQANASVAVLDVDNFVVTWSGNGEVVGNVDDAGVFARQFGSAVTLNDFDPEIAPGQSGTVSEAAENGTIVLTVNATDADAGTNFSAWTIVSGNAGDVFQIDSNSGEISLRDASQLNFESVDLYTLGIRVSDGVSTAVGDVVINVNDANDPATGQPRIRGDYVSNSTLSVDLSEIQDEDGVGIPTYQWYRDGVAVASATDEEYVLRNDDIGAEISVLVSFIDGQGNSEGPFASDPTDAVVVDPITQAQFAVASQSRTAGASASSDVSDSTSSASASDEGSSRESTTTDSAESDSRSGSDGDGDASSEKSGSDKAVAVQAASQGGQESGGTAAATNALPVAAADQSNESSNDSGKPSQIAIAHGSSIGSSGSSSHSRFLRLNNTGQSNTDSDTTRINNEASGLMWQDLVVLTRPGAMWDELDQRQQGVESLIQGDLIVVGSAGAAASSFTVGAIAWAMRSGFLVSGLIAHMPAWSGVDPLMVMQGLGSGGAEGSTETLEELMDRQSKAMESEDASQGEQ